MTDSHRRLSSLSASTTIRDQLGIGAVRLAWIGTVGSKAFSGLAGKAGDSEAMRQVIDVASRTPATALSSITGSQLSDSAPPLMSTGRRFCRRCLVETSRLTDLIGRESGPGAGAGNGAGLWRERADQLHRRKGSR